MCGIVFVYDSDAGGAGLESRVTRALGQIEHRGPDGSGLWLDAAAAMGHRRLSIIDLELSEQPMWSSDGRFVLTYNGEIYNYAELRAELTDRWEFRTLGDTEVLLAGLVTVGTGILDRMEGMWAFALWDKETRTLTLGRDRMGKKPLYYRRTRQGFSCASELAALKSLGGAWSEDLDSTADYLRYGYCLPGTTAYRDIFELLPGHVGTWRPGGELEEDPYWAICAGGFRGDREEAAELLDRHLTKAVERRLVADVEVGAFLSGGIDSSLIVAIVRSVLQRPIKTFTIGFSEASFDEREHARLVAERFATEHHEEILEQLDRNALESLILDHVGQPFADPSLLPTALVSRLAARHVKVALSGDGGDELFSGYQRYQARALMRWYTRLPHFLRRSLERVLRAIPEPMSHHSDSLLKKAQMFIETSDRYPTEQPYVAPSFYSPAELGRLAPELAGRGHQPPGLPEECDLEDIQAMMAMDAVVYLPQDILAKVDRASMAYSLESRAPFLDSSLVRFALSVPRRWHRHGIEGKRMLRRSALNTLPRRINRRRKQGFSVPVGKWFQAELGESLLDLLRETRPPLSEPAVGSMLAAHRSGARDHGLQLWGIYAYLLWLNSSGGDD